MKSSGNRMTSAFCLAASARAARAFCRFPTMSPIVGLSCAKAMRKRFVMGCVYHPPLEGGSKNPRDFSGRVCVRRGPLPELLRNSTLPQGEGELCSSNRRVLRRMAEAFDGFGGVFDHQRGLKGTARFFRLDQRLGAVLHGRDERRDGLAQRIADLERVEAALRGVADFAGEEVYLDRTIGIDGAHAAAAVFRDAAGMQARNGAVVERHDGGD